DERPPIAAGVALIAVIPAVFVLSRLTTPVFLDRYLIPAALGWVALVSGVAQGSVRRADGGRGRWLTGVLYAATFAVIACFPPLQAMAGVRSPAPDIVVSGELAELPIVIEDAHEFWPLEYYATRARGRFHYLIDWESARDERAARGAEQQAILMDLYRREGYLEGAVTDAAGFLCANRRFLVVDRPEFPLFERRIAPQQGYRVRGVGTYRDATIRLVERQGPTC
ncbi:MAG TPA: hypothetical protein VHM30_14295, partial [Gemmatimonadaceae bacterium]|nr:hypothetical protein [Gemmatimonadaceae bacterium]